jgi:hypothetical protein
MVSMLSSNVVDHGFEPLLGATIRCHYYVPLLGETNDYDISICYFSTKHAALRAKQRLFSSLSG